MVVHIGIVHNVHSLTNHSHLLRVTSTSLLSRYSSPSSSSTQQTNKTVTSTSNTKLNEDAVSTAKPNLTHQSAALHNHPEPDITITNKSLSIRLFEAWNESSGTNEIVALKNKVNNTSRQFDATQQTVVDVRQQLQRYLMEQEDVQRQHTALLRRRDEWTTEDAHHFATLVQNEVEARQNVTNTRKQLEQAEEHSAAAQWEYMNAMRQRYHEEQIWQDKWRILGTYGTWSLIGLNTAVFMASQYFHMKREAGKLKIMKDMLDEKLSSIVDRASSSSSLPSSSAVITADDALSDANNNSNTALQDSSLTSSETSDDETATGSVQGDSNGEEKHTDTSPPIDTSPVTTLSDWKRQSQELLHKVDIPSAAFGAGVATTCCFVVGILLQSGRAR